MDEFLKQLAERLQTYDSEIITADEIADWPEGKLDELVSMGILTRTENAKGVICDQCEENCYIEPDIRTVPKIGKAVGVFVCTRNPDIGRIEIDLNRLRQWRITKKKLSQLGYGKKRRGVGGQKREEKRQNDILLMQAALLKHHGFEADTFGYEPATQKELQALTKWGQSKVHRVMKAIFGDGPMNAYKRQCRTKAITGFLKRNDDGNYTVEAVHEPIDQ